MFVPKKFKHKKKQKGKKLNTINALFTFNTLPFYKLALKSTETGHVTSKQLMAVKQTLNKVMKKKGKVKLNIFPNTQLTKKPLEVRMGKGKGNIDRWVFKVRFGTLICEIQTPYPLVGLHALKLAKYKMPLNSVIINKN